VRHNTVNGKFSEITTYYRERAAMDFERKDDERFGLGLVSELVKSTPHGTNKRYDN